MNHKTASFTRRMALGALVGATLLTALPAVALGRLTDVRIINRDSGEILTMYLYKGDYWVAGEPGARYAVELKNTARRRVLNVVSVDGVNVVTGETAAFDQPGYVLTPGQSYDVSGWRKSRREIAAFEFTSLPRSYAARTGRPDDVGVIGVAVFREKVVYRRLRRTTDRSNEVRPPPKCKANHTGKARARNRIWAPDTETSKPTASAGPISRGAATGPTR